MYEVFVVCMINLTSVDENVTPKLFQGKFDLLKPFIGSAMVAYSATLAPA